MASNFPVPPVTAAGTAPATVVSHNLIPAPAANATPLPISPRSPTAPHRPVSAMEDPKDVTTAALVLQDGTSFQGISFGSEAKSISGECVFQTGMTRAKAIYYKLPPLLSLLTYPACLFSLRYGRLSGIIDRSVLSRPNSCLDFSIDWQLRCSFSH